MSASGLRQFTVDKLITPQTLSSTTNGTGIDLQGKVNPGGQEMKATLITGASSGTSPTMDVKLQESDSLGSGYADISGATFTQVTANDAEETIHFRTNKRFVRAVFTLGGTSPTFITSCVLVSRERVVNS